MIIFHPTKPKNLFFRKQALFFGLLFWIWVFDAHSEPLDSHKLTQLDEGIAAYKAHKYTQAYKLLKPLAENGLAEAQRRLGVMYRHGRGVRQNDQIAINWYRKAAEQDHLLAQNSLGVMYRFGLGVKKNPEQGAYWLKRAARKGYRKAQENIGVMLMQGDGVKQNFKEAAHWLTRASKAGSAKAQLHLGLLHLSGKGVEQNDANAMAWIREAANRGNKKARIALAKAYQDGLYGLTKDRHLARQWYEKAGVPFK